MDKVAKHERIVSAAVELFGDREYHEVNMDAVAVAAGVGKGTLYNFFDSKEALYRGIVAHRMNRLLDILERAYDERNDFVRNLRSLVLHCHEFFIKFPRFRAMWKRAETFDNAPAERDRLFELIRAVIDQGVSNQRLAEAVRPDLAVRFVYSAIDAVGSKAEVDEILAYLIRGLGAPDTDPHVHYERYEHGGDHA